MARRGQNLNGGRGARQRLWDSSSDSRSTYRQNPDIRRPGPAGCTQTREVQPGRAWKPRRQRDGGGEPRKVIFHTARLREYMHSASPEHDRGGPSPRRGPAASASRSFPSLKPLPGRPARVGSQPQADARPDRRNMFTRAAPTGGEVVASTGTARGWSDNPSPGQQPPSPT